MPFDVRPYFFYRIGRWRKSIDADNNNRYYRNII